MTRLTINLLDRIGTINPNIYGHFAEHLGRCIYDGIWVGGRSAIPNTGGFRNDVIAALRKLKPPVIRWPGGCFADDYHWQDGIGPAGQRPRRINIHWGEVIDTNEVGTQEFVRFCRLVGAEPYICGNVGSGTVRERSASLKGNSLFLTLTNAHASETIEVVVDLLGGAQAVGCQARILSGEIHSHNTFDRPDALRPEPWAVAARGNRFTVPLPAASVAALEIALN